MPSRRFYGSLLPRRKGTPTATRACLEGLKAKYGPFDSVTRSYAQAATAMWWSFAQATDELRQAEEKRRSGKGRRPSAQAVERLRKRQGVAFNTWDQALTRLEQLASRARRTPETPAELLAQLSEANRR